MIIIVIMERTFSFNVESLPLIAIINNNTSIKDTLYLSKLHIQLKLVYLS